MENLFYSVLDKKLFWITGYSSESYNVKNIVTILTNNRNYFIRICKLQENALVNTDFINISSRYRSMRYFWVDDVETPPKEAMVLKGDWTMDKWISN